tara:strand:- start:3203 stop:3898 length:696 start_codon:yes stop_codon:yes gene_type:complete
MAMATSAKRGRSESTVSLDSILDDMDTVSYAKTGRDLSRNQLSPSDLFFCNQNEFRAEINANERSSPAPPSKKQRKSFEVYENVKDYTIKSFTSPFVPDYGEIMRTARLSGLAVMPDETPHMVALFASLYESKRGGKAHSFIQSIVCNMYDEDRAQRRNLKAAVRALHFLKGRDQTSLVRPVSLDHFEIQERKHTQNLAVSFRKPFPTPTQPLNHTAALSPIIYSQGKGIL